MRQRGAQRLDAPRLGELFGVGRLGQGDARIGHDAQRLAVALTIHFQLHGVLARRRPHAVGIGIALRQGSGRGVVQRPHEAVQAGCGRQGDGRRQPLGRGARGGRVGRGWHVGAAVAAHHGAVRIAHGEDHRSLRRALELVVDDRAKGRVCRHGLVLGHGRAGEGFRAQAHRCGGDEQARGRTRACGELAQGTDVVEDPEAAAVGGDDEIVVLHHEIAHRGARQARLQRLPVRAVVGAGVDAALGGRIEQAALHGVFAHGVDEMRGVDAVHDQLPVLAAVVGAVDVGPAVVEAVAVHGEVGRLGVVRRGLDDAHLAPGAQRGRRHVLPVRALVARAPDLAVIGADPQVVVGAARGRNGVDHAAARSHLQVQRGGGCVQRLRRAGVFAREVGADDVPVLTAVGAAVELLVGEIQHLGVAHGEGERQGPGAAMVVGIGQGGIDVARLARAQVEAIDAAAVEDVRIGGIGRDVVALAAGGNFAEVGEVDAVAVRGAAGYAGSAGILLRTVDEVRETVVGADVIELAGGLVVPGAPACAAVQGNDGALVHAEDLPLRIVGVDPQRVEVVAGGVAPERREMRAAVVAAQHDGVEHVDSIGIARIGRDLAEVPATLPQARVAAHQAPVRAGIVAAVQAAARLGVDDGVDALRRGRRQREADATVLRRQAVAELAPVLAAVARLVHAAAGTAGRRVHAPGRAPRLPEGGVDHGGIARLEGQVHRTGVGVRPQHLAPVRAAVGAEEDAALGVGPVGVAERRRQHAPGVARIDAEACDLLAVGEAGGLPGAAAVAGPEHALALGNVAAHVGLASADVDDTRIGRRQGEGADGLHRLGVEQRLPGAAGIARLPHSAIDAAEVEVFALARHAGHGQHAAAAEGADAAPVQGIQLRRRERGGGGTSRGGGEQQEQDRPACNGHGISRDGGGTRPARACAPILAAGRGDSGCHWSGPAPQPPYRRRLRFQAAQVCPSAGSSGARPWRWRARSHCGLGRPSAQAGCSSRQGDGRWV